MASTYKHNSYGLVTEQQVPDENGPSYFWYDRLGRIMASQNDKQMNLNYFDVEENHRYTYSYTKYDNQGRVIEAGQMHSLVDFHSISATSLYSCLNSPIFPDNLYPAIIREQVTQSFYEDDIQNPASPINQNNLRGMLASQTIEYTYDPDNNIYDHATFYDYDIYGNVSSICQTNHEMEIQFAQGNKIINYNYDLISGVFNEVRYQNGNYDRFSHHFIYDEDLRIKEIYTSQDNLIWEKEAKYFYYPHGPLARVEIGDKQVQATDYAHTIHGWQKGVNSNTLESNRDMGKDGNAVASNLHKNFGRDAYGFSLGYYNNDYIDIASTASSTHFLAAGSASTHELFNGNISYMVSTITNVSTSAVMPILYHYRYDQLNRIKTMTGKLSDDATLGVIATNSWATISIDNVYNTAYTYDGNGNIKTLSRYDGQTTPVLMDDLVYTYDWDDKTNKTNLRNNRLYHVDDDLVLDATFTTDIDDQGTYTFNSTTNDFTSTNYSYDKIGNLIYDEEEGIGDIDWTVNGKVKSITRISGCSDPDIEFHYDVNGNRVCKIVKPDGYETTELKWTYTFYIRNAKGGLIATYKRKPDDEDLFLSEKYIYGHDRLGLVDVDKKVDNLPELHNLNNNRNFGRVLGDKFFELTNHLGNVLTTVSDRKKAIEYGTSGNIDYYVAMVKSSADYYPFGMMMPGRKFNDNSYRHGYQGYEKDDELFEGGYTTHYRLLDSRLGRWFSTDPVFLAYESPYVSMGNSPIMFIDIFGDIIVPVGSDEFIAKFNEDMRMLRATPRGAAMYKALHESDVYVYVRECESIVETQHVKPGIGVSNIDYSITSDGKKYDGVQYVSWIGLGHELWHAYVRHGFAGKEKIDWKRPAQEKEAIDFENYLRCVYKKEIESMGMPFELRYRYSNKYQYYLAIQGSKVFDSSMDEDDFNPDGLSIERVWYNNIEDGNDKKLLMEQFNSTAFNWNLDNNIQRPQNYIIMKKVVKSRFILVEKKKAEKDKKTKPKFEGPTTYKF